MQLSHHHQRGSPRCPRPSSPISSKNYSSWCLRGWLLCKLGRPRVRRRRSVSLDDPRRARRAAAAVAVVPGAVPDPRRGQGVGHAGDCRIPGRDLAQRRPAARRSAWRARIAGRSAARCTRASTICARPCSMNLKAHHPGLQGVGGAQADIERVMAIWRQCLDRMAGPYLFGQPHHGGCRVCHTPCAAASRPTSVKLDAKSSAYTRRIVEWPAMARWIEDAPAPRSRSWKSWTSSSEAGSGSQRRSGSHGTA